MGHDVQWYKAFYACLRLQESPSLPAWITCKILYSGDHTYLRFVEMQRSLVEHLLNRWSTSTVLGKQP